MTFKSSWTGLSALVSRTLALALLYSLQTQAATVREALERAAVQVRTPERAVLLGAALSGSRWVAVGEHGLIVATEDGGKHWQQAPSPVSVTLTAVRFWSEHTGLAVGHGGTVLLSDNGGLTWTRRLDGRALAKLMLADAQARNDADAIAHARQHIEDGPDKPLLDLALLGPGRAIVVGAYGLALLTQDGGKSWTSLQARLDNPKSLHLYAVRQRGERIVIAGEQGLMLLSDDGGQSFTRVATPYKGSFFVTELPNDRDIVLAGLRGHVLRSSNGGADWTTLRTRLSASINASSVQADGSILLASQAGQVLTLRDDDLVAVNDKQPLPPVNAMLAASGRAILALTVLGTVVLPLTEGQP